MPTYYVDPINGNDGDDGLSWANAFLTLNGAEDEPVAANDTVYVGPGVYREMLTLDVDGGAGNIITYIGDVSGENTDGVGGVVRITGSDNDQSAARASCIDIAGKDYRTFRGFRLDGCSGNIVHCAISVTDLIIEDTVVESPNLYGMRFFGAINSDNVVIRRCLFLGCGVSIDLGAPYAGSGNLIENSVFINGSYNYPAIDIDRCDGITVRNCFIMGYYGVYATGLTGNGYHMDVNNCILFGGRYGLYAAALGDIVEDYNSFDGYAVDRTSVNTGANSNTYFTLVDLPLLFDGFKFPWWFGELSEWSQLRAITGTAMSADDLRGITRPPIDSKKSWGATQFADTERETTTTHGGSDASIVFNDAGRHHIWVPVEDSETDFSVWVYREADYAGNLPQMIIKQPGQADDVTTDAAAASQWNELTTTLTPAAEPPYVIVELVSRNTDVANPATNDVFFDDLTVT